MAETKLFQVIYLAPNPDDGRELVAVQGYMAAERMSGITKYFDESGQGDRVKNIREVAEPFLDLTGPTHIIHLGGVN